METADLFAGFAEPDNIRLGEQSFILPGFALGYETALLQALPALLQQAPLRSMQTPGGKLMSVQTSSCGDYGWVSDRYGYRYSEQDPLCGQPWPAMPPRWQQLAAAAAACAGFAGFVPDSCLINRYAAGARMGLHQDKDERDFAWPIVSVSLGLPARFQFGGLQRSDPVKRFLLRHGDVVVWGGVDRLRFHGVMPLAAGEHSQLGAQRINLTFRRAR